MYRVESTLAHVDVAAVGSMVAIQDSKEAQNKINGSTHEWLPVAHTIEEWNTHSFIHSICVITITILVDTRVNIIYVQLLLKCNSIRQRLGIGSQPR